MTAQSTDVVPAPTRRFFLRRPRLLVAIGLMIGLLVFHNQILAAAFSVMVVDQTVADCRSALIANATPECYDTAAAMIQQGQVDLLWVVQAKPSRSTRIGAMPTSQDLASRELKRRGVDANRIEVIQTQAVTPHQLFRQFDQAVSQRSRVRVSVVSTATLSRYHRKVIDQALPIDRRKLYRVRAVVHKTTDRDRWWRDRSSVREVLNHGLRLAFVTLRGESEVDTRDPYQHLMAASSRQQARNRE